MAPPGYPTTLAGRIRAATLNSWRGLVFAYRSERAVRQEIVLLAVAVLAGLFIAPSVAWYAGMVGVMLLVIAIELLNTAIEKLADHVMAELHPQIAVVKDCGSAAVGIALALAGFVWLAALVARFWS